VVEGRQLARSGKREHTAAGAAVAVASGHIDGVTQRRGGRVIQPEWKRGFGVPACAVEAEDARAADALAGEAAYHPQPECVGGGRGHLLARLRQWRLDALVHRCR
jgi:hypothetical protein